MSTPAPPPGSQPPEWDPNAPPATGDGRQPPPQKHSPWLWPAIIIVAILGVLAGVIVSQNKASVSSQQSTSTVNNLGLTVQAPASTVTNKTVTQETKTVTAPAPPAKTTTTTVPSKTTTTPTETTPAPAAPGP